jgi:DNA-binding MarR family transcriptional regulator
MSGGSTRTRHLQREFGLSGSDFEILVNLSESPTGRMRAFELGEATQWEKSRMSHHLTRMEKRGLIRKEACDARYPEIVLTGPGLEAIRACAPVHGPGSRLVRRRTRRRPAGGPGRSFGRRGRRDRGTPEDVLPPRGPRVLLTASGSRTPRAALS